MKVGGSSPFIRALEVCLSRDMTVSPCLRLQSLYRLVSLVELGLAVVAQSVRALHCQCRSRGFESRLPRVFITLGVYMHHYLLIRVEEPVENTNPHISNTGLLRNLIHWFSRENDIQVADNLIRADRKTLYDGRPVPYKEAEELFKKIMPEGYSK